jgi:hypothetical protein
MAKDKLLYKFHCTGRKILRVSFCGKADAGL